MDLDALSREFQTVGLGEHLYSECLQAVHAVIQGRGYPTSYSPTGQWDDDAYTRLAHDWAVERLWLDRQLERFLANETLHGFRTGLELSFTDFLRNAKRRTQLDNIFGRMDAILREDERFRCFRDSPQKILRLWGLHAWEAAEPYIGADRDLFAAAGRIRDVSVLRQRPDAQRLSPVLSNRDLAQFLHRLLGEVGSLLTLPELVAVLKHRFNLLDVSEVSLEAPVAEGDDGRATTLADTLGTGQALDDTVLQRQDAIAVLNRLTPRQKVILLAYARPGATLTGVAGDTDCSKSTVANELRRALALIHEQVETADEAQALYGRILGMLSAPSMQI